MRDFLFLVQNYEFMQNALLAGLLISIACGITGTFVVIKKISYISGGIAHAVLGGMGFAYYLNFDPLVGATIFAIIAALILGLISIKVKQYEDVLIGALWAIGMALGLIFISLSPGYTVDLMSFLFGNILMVSRADLGRMLLLNIVIIGTVLLFFQQLAALCFDEEYAKLRGLKVEALYILLLCLIALSVVMMIRMVGLILVIALLTLPAAIAGLFAKSIAQMMLLAIIVGSVFTISGLMGAVDLDLPVGPVIILTAGLGFILTWGFRALKPRVLTKRRAN